MDLLIKQMRGRFSGVGQESTEERSSTRERSIPPQKTQSFKGGSERKKAQNWFQRQFSTQMNQDNNSTDEMEQATAVAAAAYAVNSLEEPGIPVQKKTSEGPRTPLTKMKSKKEDRTIATLEPGRASRRFSGESSKKSSETPDTKVPTTAATSGMTPDKAIGRAPSTKKNLTFADKQLDSTGSVKPQGAAQKPDLPSPIPPTETIWQSSTRPGIGETKADAWEEAELGRIKERYEKLNSTILDWENKKKVKARKKLDRTESEMDRRRAITLQNFRNETEKIDQISGGARAQAEEKRRNEELKAKEKANILRTTGKLPKTCLCF